MLLDVLRKIFKRDLTKLMTELESYKDEKKLWHFENDIANSGGNLCLHLVGNLNTYIGAALGNTEYERNRVGEFADKNIPRIKLLAMVEETIQIVDSTLQNLGADALNNEYPMPVLNEPITTEFFLVHLCAHLSYHLGQINYHRRLLDH